MSFLYESFCTMCKHYPQNTALVYHQTVSKKTTFTYAQLYKLIQEICIWLTKCITKSECIGILLNEHPLLVPTLIGVHRLNCSFFCISEETLQSAEMLNNLGCVTHFISSESIVPNNAIVKSSFTNYFKINLWTLPDITSTQIADDQRIAYVIQTSGSTGDPKLVMVPHECILPNIIQLKNCFNISHKDTIFLSTTPTFDPFIIELYLCFSTGACAITVSKMVKYSTELVQILFKTTPITFLQTTPSLFKLFYMKKAKDTILSQNSKLRILVLGGEVCPTASEINFWKHKENKTVLYFLYGITEVSCWAMIKKINVNEIMNKSDDDIDLGEPMAETLLEIRDEYQKCSQMGELFIGSTTRKCILNNENVAHILNTNTEIFRGSGDLVYKRNDKYYYHSRKDDTVKRYGSKINLKKIERRLKLLKELEDVCCLWINQRNKLVIFYKPAKDLTQDYIWHLLKLNTDYNTYPDYICPVDYFPLTTNGKVSKTELVAIFESKINTSYEHGHAKDLFVQELKNVLQNLNFKTSFLNLGGSSITALTIITKLENVLKINLNNLMSMLLDENIPLEHSIKYVSDQLILENEYKELTRKRNIVKQAIGHLPNFKLHLLWKYDLQKCIDATPTLFQNMYVSVGSHSHKLATLDMHTGELKSIIVLPDRIESAVTYIKSNNAVVGCYDGFLYCFDFLRGECLWNFKTDDILKSKAIYVEEYDMIIITSYDCNIYAIQSRNGTIMWSIELCKKPLLSTPCFSPVSKKLLCCSLDGKCISVDIQTSSINWIRKFQHPIFSNSILLYEDLNTSYYLLAEVDGNLHCLDQDGLKIWSFRASGSVYSSFAIHKTSKSSYKILFGCYDKFVYCLEVKNDKPHLKWKTLMESQIYSTPTLFTILDETYVVCAATIGQICLLNLNTGLCICDFYLNGECFSSPIVCKNNIYVGCRDNNLYCIQINEVN